MHPFQRPRLRFSLNFAGFNLPLALGKTAEENPCSGVSFYPTHFRGEGIILLPFIPLHFTNALQGKAKLIPLTIIPLTQFYPPHKRAADRRHRTWPSLNPKNCHFRRVPNPPRVKLVVAASPVWSCCWSARNQKHENSVHSGRRQSDQPQVHSAGTGGGITITAGQQ